MNRKNKARKVKVIFPKKEILDFINNANKREPKLYPYIPATEHYPGQFYVDMREDPKCWKTSERVSFRIEKVNGDDIWVTVLHVLDYPNKSEHCKDSWNTYKVNIKSGAVKKVKYYDWQ